LNTHSLIAGFTDEAQYNFGRYRGLAMVSGPQDEVPRLRQEAHALLEESGITEWKWEKVRTARARFASSKLLRWAIGAAELARLRVDTLTWDVEEDSRAGRGVPHIANLRRMYRALLEDVVPRRWGADTTWKLYPDEQSAMPWERLVSGITQVTGITSCHSHEYPLIQLADLFAGLAVYSRGSYDTYERWLTLPPDQRLREPEECGASLSSASLHFSASDRVRCRLLDEFFTRCKQGYLGVSLRTRRGLFTADPYAPLAFRWWTPRGA
jgi:hypothetical protein